MAQRVVVRLLAGLVLVAWILGWPAAASADLFLVFEEGQAAVGQRVEVISGDRQGPAVWPPVLGVHLYFVPMSHAKSPARQTGTGPPDDPAWLPLGPLRHTHRGVVRLSFVVPNVAPGSYTIGFWCIPCAPPKGATFTGAYPGHAASGKPFTTILRVIPAAAVVPPPRANRTYVWEFILGITTLAGVGAALAYRLRRFARRT